MVDLTAEDQCEATEWGQVGNCTTDPLQRGLRPRKSKLDCCKGGGGGGDQDWESEDN